MSPKEADSRRYASPYPFYPLRVVSGSLAPCLSITQTGQIIERPGRKIASFKQGSYQCACQATQQGLPNTPRRGKFADQNVARVGYMARLILPVQVGHFTDRDVDRWRLANSVVELIRDFLANDHSQPEKRGAGWRVTAKKIQQGVCPASRGQAQAGLFHESEKHQAMPGFLANLLQQDGVVGGVKGALQLRAQALDEDAFKPQTGIDKIQKFEMGKAFALNIRQQVEFRNAMQGKAFRR